MRFCSLSAVRARCSFALKRDLFRKALGLRFISSVISPEALFFLSATFFLAAFLPDFFFLCAAENRCNFSFFCFRMRRCHENGSFHENGSPLIKAV